MKKLVLFLLISASTQIQGMDFTEQLTKEAKHWFDTTRAKVLSKVYATLFNTDKLWREAEFRAELIDHYLHKKCCTQNVCPLVENGYYYYYEAFYKKTAILSRIYGKHFYSKHCHNDSNGSCLDDLKAFKDEVEKMRRDS